MAMDEALPLYCLNVDDELKVNKRIKELIVIKYLEQHLLRLYILTI
jgi:hypothetical protein